MTTDNHGFRLIWYVSLIVAGVIGVVTLKLINLPVRGIWASLYMMLLVVDSVLWMAIIRPPMVQRGCMGMISFVFVPILWGSYATWVLLVAAVLGVLWFSILPDVWEYMMGLFELLLCILDIMD